MKRWLNFYQIIFYFELFRKKWGNKIIFLSTLLKWPHSLRAIRGRKCPFWKCRVRIRRLFHYSLMRNSPFITSCKSYYSLSFSLFLSRQGKNNVALINFVIHFCYQYFCFEMFFFNFFFKFVSKLCQIFFQCFFH